MRMLYSRRGEELIALAERHQSSRWHDDMERLDRELVYGPRLTLGAVAVALGLVAGVLVALGRTVEADAASVMFLVLAVVFAAGSTGLGLLVVNAGHRVVNTYVAMTPHGGALRVRHVLPLLWATGSWLRPLLTGVSVLGFIAATSTLALGLRDGDPAGLGDAADAVLTMGLIWSVVFAASTVCLLVGDLRVALALAKGIGHRTASP